RLALELSDKMGDVTPERGSEPAPMTAPAETALQALARLGYNPGEAERALRQALTGAGAADAETLVRRTPQILTNRRSMPAASPSSQSSPPSTTAEWICTRCGSTNRKLVPAGVTRAADECVTCHAPHELSADARPVRWRARPV